MAQQPETNRSSFASPFSYRDERELVRHFVRVLEERLAGRREQRIVNTVPGDHCHLGVLGPWSPDIEQPEPLELEESEAKTRSDHGDTQQERQAREPVESKEDDEERAPTPEAMGGRDSVRRSPSSLGFEVVLQPEQDGTAELDVTVRFAVYSRRLPTYEEQLSALGQTGMPAGERGTARDNGGGTHARGRADRLTLAEVCQRHEIVVSHIRFPIRITGSTYSLGDDGRVQRELDAILDAAVQDSDALREFPRTPEVPREALQSREAFEAYLVTLCGGHEVVRVPLRARIDVRVEPWTPGRVRVGCYIRNDTRRDEVRRFLDQYHIVADARLEADVTGGRIHPIEILPVPHDYQFDRRVWGVGHATSVVVSGNSIRTEALAQFEQPRRTTSSEPKARFGDLIEDPVATLERIHSAMEEYAADWERRVLNENALNLKQDELSRCRQDWETFRGEARRFAAGIAALDADERLKRAFVAMNRVFERIAHGRYDHWRLFQIIFIVSQLPSLALREGITEGMWPQGTRREWPDALKWVDVLWFPTGGGKTEAYLGLVSSAALYDRLRGKQFGVTAWLRFPLRMLSVQQLQRAIKVVWETEKERQTLLGGTAGDSDPISLGYFVGRSSTPNALSRDEFHRLEDPNQAEKLRVVSDCPACGKLGAVQAIPDVASWRIRHVCQACQAELPLYVADDEIYRHLPTLVVGTIDKMATLGFQVRFPALWGGVTWRCPHHGYGLGDWCVDSCPTNRSRSRRTGRRPVTPYDPTPSFHVQDELHLLQEELGAFAGHYETLIKHCEEAVGGQPPKIVAATATIEGFEHQVRHVYGVRDARRFPGRGYERYESFYSSLDRDPQDPSEGKVARVYLAFRPPQLHAADGAALCTRILLEEVKRLYENPYDLAAMLPDARTEEQVRQLLLYYTSTLTYVGSMNWGTRIQQDLHRHGGTIRPADIRDLATEFHSSRSTMAELSDVIHRLEAPPPWENEAFLDALVATDVISHGVDVERLNLMVMDNIPEETARYIQASSRSGRQHVGLVLAVLTSYSLRASSIYHRFREYHDHMERLVSPVPVNRFAKYAVRRTAPGVMTGLFFGRYNPSMRTTRLRERHEAARFLGTMEAPRNQETQNEFVEAVASAYGLGVGVYPESLEKALREAIEEEVDRFLYSVRSSRDRWLTEAVQPKPMMSLRDVEAGVPFRPADIDYETLMWFRGTRS